MSEKLKSKQHFVVSGVHNIHPQCRGDVGGIQNLSRQSSNKIIVFYFFESIMSKFSQQKPLFLKFNSCLDGGTSTGPGHRKTSSDVHHQNQRHIYRLASAVSRDLPQPPAIPPPDYMEAIRSRCKWPS